MNNLYSWENSDWDLKCEFCKEPTGTNPCFKCSNAIKLSNLPGVTLSYHPHYLTGVFGSRSSEWNKTRLNFIKENPFCAWCKSIKLLNVHHIKPFHTWPELELKKNKPHNSL